MNSMLRQDARFGRLATVLGESVLVLVQFAGAEAISSLFDYQVDCLSENPDIDFDALVGTHATVIVRLRSGEERAFDGIVTEARWLGPEGPGHQYRLTLSAWFQLCKLRRNQRIFHEKTVVQIVSEVLGEYVDAGSFKIKLTQSYPKLEYTVQYRESDFAFVSRLLERFGISYHFQHRAGAHDMVLTDGPDAHPAIGARPYKPAGDRHQQDIEHFHSWHPSRRITTGAIKLTDYNFKTPTAKMESQQQGDAAHAEGDIESFDYPGDYISPPRGKVVAQLRARQERGQDRRFVAMGDMPDLAAGAVVTLSGEPVPGTGQDYMCLSAQHRYAANAYGSGDRTGDEVAYQGRYVLMPTTAPLHPERKTPRALVQGPQTARVVGEGEIDCDEYGRILVRFHWDLDDAYSMRCRVSQNWAGNGWGGMVIPRIGMEVVVEFIEGDPDQPLVTGCVYNGRNKVPYDLPAHKTKSVFRTDTHKGSGFNELSFEDQNGIEKIYMHAQRDLAIKVENHATERVDRNKITSVGGARINETLLSVSENVGHNLTFNIGAGAAERVVTGNLASSVWGIAAAGYFVDDLAALSSGGGQFVVNASGSITMAADQSYVIDARHSFINDIGKSYVRTVGADTRVTTTGSNTDTTGTIKVIEAHEKIHLRCGASEIIMEPDGTITIKGLQLLVEEKSLMKVQAGKIELN
ncbi:MAG: type VI secretion system Vgr family protein [Paracoccaceae bacterium]